MLVLFCPRMFATVCMNAKFFVDGLASKFMNNPRNEHWTAVKWILRYLKGLVNEGIVLEMQISISSVRFFYFDFGENLDCQRSTTRYMFTVASGPVN